MTQEEFAKRVLKAEEFERILKDNPVFIDFIKTKAWFAAQYASKFQVKFKDKILKKEYIDELIDIELGLKEQETLQFNPYK